MERYKFQLLERQILINNSLKSYAVKCRFEKSDFTSSNLTRANFTGSTLIEVNFKNSNLIEANFTSSNINGANFEGANLNNAIWTDGSVCGVESIGKCNK